MKIKKLFLIFLLAFTSSNFAQTELFSFEVTADMRRFAKTEYQNSQYFLGALEAIKKIGHGKFMISPGDIDPPWFVCNLINQTFGDGYLWYPVIGNHDSETPKDMHWLRDYCKQHIQNLTRKGPTNCTETTYSFDYKNVHFAVINEHFDNNSDVGSKGDICDSTFCWLKKDLAKSKEPIKLVIGNEPMVSLPDYDNGRHRHKGDNLDAHPENSHRFQQLLKDNNVLAYLCGHTRNFSFGNINGITQIDAGHSRGIGDKGAPSTFLKFHVFKDHLTFDVYRDDSNGGEYKLKHTFELK
ncbi:MAG: metallophosphoesterase [Melioribacteraceae bacterium]|nr:metallophosphoesterase [Melioribacteraceae bacterium]